ncbi:hypothetical protein [Chromobacterium amazonense]|uniref:hypothetical protein n=1 Tax=Chromobacterium amazonense TaxID=1382803 RepID=UPI0031F6BA33
MAKTHHTREQLSRAKALIGEEWPWVWDGLNHKQPLGFLHHPDLTEYTAHYLHSSPDLAHAHFGEGVARVLLNQYPSPNKFYIRTGSSYYLEA